MHAKQFLRLQVKYQRTVSVTNPALDVVSEPNISFHTIQTSLDSNAGQMLTSADPASSRACIGIIIKVKHAGAPKPFSSKTNQTSIISILRSRLQGRTTGTLTSKTRPSQNFHC